MSIHNAGMRPKAIMPEPRIAERERSEVCAMALTELRNSSGDAEPKATRVTAARRQRDIIKRLIV